MTSLSDEQIVGLLSGNNETPETAALLATVRRLWETVQDARKKMMRIHNECNRVLGEPEEWDVVAGCRVQGQGGGA